MQTVSDTSLLEQIKEGDNASFEILYRFYFPSVASYIKQNQGNKEDAEDVFQEAILVLLEKVKQPDFNLSASLKTYLYAICKNIWLKRLRSSKLISVEDYEKFQLESEPEMLELTPEKSNEEKVTYWLTKVTVHCQNILKAIFFYNQTVDSLMKTVGWKNKHVAANQQYKCLQQMKREGLKDSM